MSYARLNERYVLRGFRDLPYVLIDREKGRREVLDQETFRLLELCNGKIDMKMVFLSVHQRELFSELVKNGRVVCTKEPSPALPVQEYRKADNYYLRRIHWSVTGKCNLKCRHCYMSAPDYKYEDLPTETCFAIIDQMERANVAEVSITGA